MVREREHRTSTAELESTGTTPPLRNPHCELGIGNNVNRTEEAWVDQLTICERLVTVFVDCMLQLVHVTKRF